MDIRQLKYFLAIAEEGKVTKAAKRLNMSQPPLSKQLKLLEEELDVILFDRNSRNLELTEAGIILKNKAEQIMQLVDSTKKELKNYNKGIEGTLGIGTVYSSGITILPSKIAEYREKYSNIDFQVWEGNSFRIIELLNNGVIDIGFVREPFNSNKFNSIVIKDNLGNNLNDHFVTIGNNSIYGSKHKDNINLIELKNIPLILNRRYNEVITIACNKQGFRPKVVIGNDDTMSSLSLAREGIGIAILPLTATSFQKDFNFDIRKIINPCIESRLNLIWPKNKVMSKIVQNFINMFLNK